MFCNFIFLHIPAIGALFLYETLDVPYLAVDSEPFGYVILVKWGKFLDLMIKMEF